MICNNCGSTNCSVLKKQPGKIRCNRCLHIWDEEQKVINEEKSNIDVTAECKKYFELTYKLFEGTITESEKNQRLELQIKLFKYFGVLE